MILEEDKKEVKKQCKYSCSDTNTMKEKELEDQEVSQVPEKEAETATTIEEGTETPEIEEASTTTTVWMAVWDANAQAYYWWNTVTNETTWNNPEGYENDHNTTAVAQPGDLIDSILDTIDTNVRKELGDDGIVYNTQDTTVPYSNYIQDATSYSSQAHFNARTGRFTTQDDVMQLNPDNFSIENRATKQMSYYFDVDNYTEEYNRRRLQDSGKKKPLTRKQVDYFKRMKKEKKQKRAREWLLQ